MTAIDRETLKHLLDEAIARPTGERAAFLEEACHGDDTLHREVGELLAAYEEASGYFAGLADGLLPGQEAPPVVSDASREADPDALLGDRISHYEILERLGEGGMGVVYKARHLALDRFAALKFLPPHLSADDEARERFVHEARAAYALDHPNICTIYDIGETEEGQFYIAMAYYEGETLKHKIRRGALPLDVALNYAVQMAEGLSRAHAAGIVHRDVKPANVMVTREGVVKLLDFGVAKVGTVNLTQSGTTLGTVAYMSPEQARGEPVDHRSDIWSLGVVCYEMLTGRRPFPGDYEQAVMYHLLHTEPDAPSGLRPDLPADVEAVVRKCLAKPVRERYQTTAGVFADLYRLRRQLRGDSTGAGGTPGREVRAERPAERDRPSRRARVFISYKRSAHPDARVADALCDALKQDHDVFIDRMMLVGTRWIEQLETELARADFLIVLLSHDAVHSEMVLGEIETARRMATRQGGRPAILPVRLAYREPFAYPLNTYLDPLNWAFWEDDADTPRLAAELREAVAHGTLASPTPSRVRVLHDRKPGALPEPLAAAQPVILEMPEGTMDPQSVFYVERPEDEIALRAVARQGVTLTLKGPRQMGKSSLLIRSAAAAARAGKEVVFLDFQLFDQHALHDAETFFRQFCTWITDELDLENAVDAYWDRPLGNSQLCTRYMGRHLLKRLNRPLFLAMDEVERVFDAPFRSDFFSMLRSWHNDRAVKPRWKQLDLALVTSTEPYQLIENLNQSPFNVGEVIALTDFTADQVHHLNRLHGEPMSADEVEALMDLLEGHPYLVRKALFLVAGGRIDAADLLEQAAGENGPFSDHLRHHLFRLHGQDDLVDAMDQVLQDHRCADEDIFWRLRGAGLVRRVGRDVLPRCRLYADFFRARLHG